MTPASIGRVLEMVDHVAEKAEKSGASSKGVIEMRDKIRSHLQKSNVRPEDIGLFIDSVGARFEHIERRTPAAIARRALEECVELCLATGVDAGALMATVVDSLANQSMKASRAAGHAVFPSELREEYDLKEVAGEAADVLLCLRDLEYVAKVDAEFQAHKKFSLLRSADQLYMSPAGTVRKVKAHIKDPV
jgi:NTP pyrophosphatase (non-canonical NTP hydrolase)